MKSQYGQLKIYDAWIPTNVVNSFYFKLMLDVIIAIGHEHKLAHSWSTYHQFQIKLLKYAKKEVLLIVNFYHEIWIKVRCTIIGDGRHLLRVVDCNEKLLMGYMYKGMYMICLSTNRLFNCNKILYIPYTQIIKAMLGSKTM